MINKDFSPVIDLDSLLHWLPHYLPRWVASEHGTDGLFPGHGFPAAPHVSPMRQPLWRGPQCSGVHLSGPIPLHGLRAIDLPGKPAGYRGVSAGTASEAVPHGNPRHDSQEHAGRRQRGPRLAHLRRLRPSPDRHGQEAVCRRGIRSGDRLHGLRSRFDNHRPVSFALPLGAIPQDQGTGKPASAWCS